MSYKQHIVAPTGLVQRVYLVRDYDTKPRRGLIDQCGLVFESSTQGSASFGWTNTQGNKSVTYIPVGGPVPMWDINDMWSHWWTPKAWAQPAWSWVHSKLV